VPMQIPRMGLPARRLLHQDLIQGELLQAVHGGSGSADAGENNTLRPANGLNVVSNGTGEPQVSHGPCNAG